MPKLTPKEAFEMLDRLYGGITELKIATRGVGTWVMRGDSILASHGGYCELHIDWGDATSYKPERWRPATIEDVKRALDEPFECRVSGDGGFVLAGGFVKADGSLVFECRKDGCTAREHESAKVEVLDA